MELFEAIRTRRSVRKFTDQAVSRAQIETLLASAMQAPSARNQQAWRFIVLTEKTSLQAIQEFHPASTMLSSASAALVICADLEAEKNGGAYWLQDCSAANQNILLAAHGMGLGAVWLGIYPREPRINGLKMLLDLPETVIPMAVVAIGYPAETKPAEKRYDPSKVHWEHW